MNIDKDKYTLNINKGPKHEKAATVNLILEFIGEPEKGKRPYTFWLAKIGYCSYGQAMEIIKSLNTLPVKYSKAGTIINKLKKINEKLS